MFYQIKSGCSVCLFWGKQPKRAVILEVYESKKEYSGACFGITIFIIYVGGIFTLMGD
jgi:hypothetical protein